MAHPVDGVIGAWLRRAGRVGRSVLLGTARTIVATLILVAIAINFANVVARYLFSAPLVWAEEIMVYLLIWCVFIGSVLVSWERDHLKMDLLTARLPAAWRRVVGGLELAVTAGVCAFMIVQAYEVARLMVGTGQKSVVAQVPMVVPHAAALLGFVLILLVVAARWRKYLTGTDVRDTAGSALGDGGALGRDANPPRADGK